jgi:hypothetical protein
MQAHNYVDLNIPFHNFSYFSAFDHACIHGYGYMYTPSVLVEYKATLFFEANMCRSIYTPSVLV